jgi:hypothetical protein
MRSLPTALTAATAAALAALAVTVTVPASGDDGPSTKVDPGPGKVDRQPDEAGIRACLTAHGATVPDGDGRVLKEWIIGSRTAAEKEALDACGIRLDEKPGDGGRGPDEATIRACLKDRGVTVPDGDGRVLKEWIIADHTTAEKQALKACGMALDVKPTNQAGEPCGGKDAAAVRGRKPADPRRRIVVTGT